MKAVGLVDAHAYSLIEVKTINSEKGSVDLVKVRNPWGKREWNGDWSDSSPLWTEKTKA
jgi:calpain-15